MRSSPPVVVHTQPQWAVQALVALVVALAASGLACWVISHEWRAWPVALVVPLLAVHAWREAAVSPRRLRWDGEVWWLTAASLHEEVPVSVTIVIDLDAWLLLKVRPGPCWLPLARAQQAQWGALRATLFAAPGAAVRR